MGGAAEGTAAPSIADLKKGSVPFSAGQLVWSQADSQTLGQELASGACTMTNEPSAHAQPHNTGGGGAGTEWPRPASMLEIPMSATPTETNAANRASFFMVILLGEVMRPSTLVW